MKKHKIPFAAAIILSALFIAGCDDSSGKSSKSLTWTHPTSLTDNISPDGESANIPRVAIDDSGNAIVVWYQSDGTNDQIYMSEFRNGTWTHPDSLTEDHISLDGQNASNPQVAMDNNGNAIIVWSQRNGSVYQIFKSEYRNGTWTHPSTISNNISPDGGDTWVPQVAMDNNGNAIIVWCQSDGANTQVFRSEYREGESGWAWTHPTSLADDHINPECLAGISLQNPQVAMDENGNAIIVWQQNTGGAEHIFMSEYRNGTWTDPGNTDAYISPVGSTATDPVVAMDNDGNALISWSQLVVSTDNYEVFMSEYRNGTDGWQWTNPGSQDDYFNPAGYGVGFVRVSMDNNGNAIIAWEQYVGGYGRIFRSDYRSSAWDKPADDSEYISPVFDITIEDQDAYICSAVMSDNGSALIVWYGYDNDGYYQIYKSEYRGGSWTDPADPTDNISPDSADADYADAAINSKGQAIIAWGQYDGYNYQIYISELR